MTDQVYLRSHLSMLAPFIASDDVTDIYINRPHEVWTESSHGLVERHVVAALDAGVLSRLARQIAAYSHQGINREHPILSAALPGGERVQIVIPPATRGDIAIAIRKHVLSDRQLQDYAAARAFDHINDYSRRTEAADQGLRSLYDAADYIEFLSAAVQARRNILISGGTSTGKTSFLNALLREVAPSERLILIEDTPELQLRHQNAIGLLASRSVLGESDVTADDLLTASLRLRPDRIILGELRGAEAFTFLRAINTGHPGSMTTIHANSPETAVEQLVLLAMQSGSRLSREDIVRYIRSTIHVYIQLDRVQGRRIVSCVRLNDRTDGL